VQNKLCQAQLENKIITDKVDDLNKKFKSLEKQKEQLQNKVSQVPLNLIFINLG